jgi:signal transduction histidine kinase
MDLREHLILYVDDEHANRVVFEQAFGKKLRVLCVGSGAEALEILKRETVAVLVTDQRMPGMSGDELLVEAKAVSPDTLRIVITAYSDLDPILRAVNQGLVVRYLIKPWDRAELDEILRWALEVFVVGRMNSAVQVRLLETERLLTLGQVAASVMHDLEQPLSVVHHNAQQLAYLDTFVPLLLRLATPGSEAVPLSSREREGLKDLAQEFPEIAKEMTAASNLMLNVVRQMKAFRRNEVRPLDGPSTDPGAVIRLAISMCRAVAMGAGCTVEAEMAVDLPNVAALSAELLQILINLLRNAVQAVERRGPSGNVKIVAVEEGNDVIFVVRDDGIGIPPDVLSKIGAAFFTTRLEGTGLGVAQVRRLVGGLGGTFRIESVEGKGTEVIFTLPKTG